jgi:voltage-gated potassium channel
MLRASLTATVLVVLYFTLPIIESLDGSTALLLAVGLLGFAGVVTWQVRAILRSHYPGLRAIESLAAAIPLFLLLFAAAYLRMADADAGAATALGFCVSVMNS